jgi:hypothetical protein
VQYTLEIVRFSQLDDPAAFLGATRSSSSGWRDTTSPWKAPERSATTRTSTPEHGLWIGDADGEVVAAALRTPPRNATEADRALLVPWLAAFAEEALAGVEAPAQDAERMGPRTARLRSWVRRRGGRTAGLARRLGRPHAERRPHRPRVYLTRASPSRVRDAVTAAVSAEQIAAGPRFGSLYTDLANPTSHGIYADIGHEPFCDPFDDAFEDE